MQCAGRRQEHQSSQTHIEIKLVIFPTEFRRFGPAFWPASILPLAVLAPTVDAVRIRTAPSSNVEPLPGSATGINFRISLIRLAWCRSCLKQYRGQ
jgi:hypothetical protein